MRGSYISYIGYEKKLRTTIVVRLRYGHNFLTPTVHVHVLLYACEYIIWKRKGELQRGDDKRVKGEINIKEGAGR